MIIKKTITSIIFVLILVSGVIGAEDDNETCLSCHDDDELTGINSVGEEVLMYIAEDAMSGSVHDGMDCIDCHSDLAGSEDYPHEEELAMVNCADCHDDVADIYNLSAHGLAKEAKHSATCASCHGSHNILSADDPEAMTSKKNLPITCSNCHTKHVTTMDPDIRLVDTYDRYMKGIHAEGIAKGIDSAASCDDCHGIHDLKRATNIESRVHKMNVPRTCAKCHNDIYLQYSRGIHGKALAVGVLDSPNCADCHGEHEILKSDDPNSPINYANIDDYVCGRCHNDSRMVEKYGLGKDRFTSYQDTYHGLAVRGGSEQAATCASCHMAHEILPSTNPASSIHLDNLTSTCQSCHEDANDEFASSYTHNISDAQYEGVNRMIEIVYIIMIILVIGGMIAHNLIILGRYLIERNREKHSKPTFTRLNGNLIFQHMVVTITFIVLVITGFALKYPNAWWVSIVNFFGIFESSRSLIHRISAVTMIYISVHHVIYIMMTRHGRFIIKEMFPSFDDLTEIKQNLFYYLGLSKVKPQFGFYDYTEKAEYWALVWGTLVMVATGLVLWFPTFFTSFMPAWVVTISETVHFYEAWLATLAIAFFHIFFVMFHPDQYPMSMTWLDGKITEEAAKHHHPRWYKQVKDEEQQAQLKEDKDSGI